MTENRPKCVTYITMRMGEARRPGRRREDRREARQEIRTAGNRSQDGGDEYGAGHYIEGNWSHRAGAESAKEEKLKLEYMNS